MINAPRVHLSVDNTEVSQMLAIDRPFSSTLMLEFLESEPLWRWECRLEVMDMTVGRRETDALFAGGPKLSPEAVGWVPVMVSCAVLVKW